jgi:hypothetical protein
MRGLCGVLAAGLLCAVVAARADEPADKIAALKKTAEANWDMVGAGAFVHLETDHLLIYAPKEWEKRLKDLGTMLEKDYDQAKGVLGYDAKTEPVPTKVLVYLFDERDHFAAFVRRVEHRRLEADDSGGYSAADDDLHLAVGPPRAKADLPQDGAAGEQLAGLLLARKAGPKTPLPGWLVEGFGRATYWHAVGAGKGVVGIDRQKATAWAQTKGGKDIWTGPLDADKAPALQGSLADYLAYGPGTSKFPAFVTAFKPEENMERKTTEKAFEDAGLKAENVDKGWKAWAK